MRSRDAASLHKVWSKVHFPSFVSFFFLFGSLRCLCSSLGPQLSSPHLLFSTLLPTSPFFCFSTLLAQSLCIFFPSTIANFDFYLFTTSGQDFFPFLSCLLSVETPYPSVPCLSSVCVCMLLWNVTAGCFQFPDSGRFPISHRYLQTHACTPVFFCPVAGQQCTVAYCTLCVFEWLQLLLAVLAASSFSASFPPLMKIQRQHSYWHRAGEKRKRGRDEEGVKVEKEKEGREKRQKREPEGGEGIDEGRGKRKH